MDSIAYLGLEIKHRELDSRILIAARLLKAGVTVFLGQQWSLFANADTLPPGVILFKTLNQIQARNMARFREHGHIVTATDEEVLGCINERCFLEAFSPLAATNCDLFFAQSKLHQESVEKKFPSMRGRALVVGNSRVDFLLGDRQKKLQPEVKQISEKYGPYILFNTNYSQINSIWKDVNSVIKIAANAGIFDVNDEISTKAYSKIFLWERENREEMINLLQWTIDQLPEKKIILRPHPGEMPDFWIKRFGRCERLHIIPRSNPHPWILGSDLVVHTSCTTGLEAALMGKPVANVVPNPRPNFDVVTSAVNPTFRTWEDASKAISAFFRNKSGPLRDDEGQRLELLSRQFTIDDREVTEKISEQLVKLLIDHDAKFLNGEIPNMRRGGFRRVTLTETMKDKISLDPNELAAMLRATFEEIGGGPQVNLSSIDDSLFLLVPNFNR